jgi:hypothetical protein
MALPLRPDPTWEADPLTSHEANLYMQPDRLVHGSLLLQGHKKMGRKRMSRCGMSRRMA